MGTLNLVRAAGKIHGQRPLGGQLAASARHVVADINWGITGGCWEFTIAFFSYFKPFLYTKKILDSYMVDYCSYCN